MLKHSSRHSLLSVTGLALLLVGCETISVTETSMPASEDVAIEVVASETSPAPSSEAPDVDVLCACENDAPTMPELTELDLAFEAIAASDLEAAQAYFDDHGATDDKRASSEAESGRAVIALLQSQSQLMESMSALEMDVRLSVINVLIMTIDQLRRESAVLSRENAKLSDELAKREAVLKRLRELALEQLED